MRRNHKNHIGSPCRPVYCFFLSHFYLAFFISHFYLAFLSRIFYLAFLSRIFYLASRIFLSRISNFLSRISHFPPENFFLLLLSRISNVPYRLPYSDVFFLSFSFPHEANKCFPFIIIYYFTRYSCIACIMLLKPMLAGACVHFVTRTTNAF